jgi:hypothetical protein
MSAIIFLLLGFLPPLAAGPLAGIVFMKFLKREKVWQQILFWVVLVGLDLLIMVWVASAAGRWSSISSLSAFFGTPLASILTVYGMRKALRALETSGSIDAHRRRWFTLGTVLIPALQLASFTALLIFAPILCKAGLIFCRKL